jgi:hypothetical protein
LRALALTGLALLALSGAALAAPAAGDEPPLAQASLFVQPDECTGHAALWLSYDGGETWHPFVQSSVNGDQSRCNPGVVREPWTSQSSLEWTPDGASHAAAPADWEKPASGRWSEAQQVTLDSRHGGATTAALATTVRLGKHATESYRLEVRWPSPYAQVGFSANTR